VPGVASDGARHFKAHVRLNNMKSSIATQQEQQQHKTELSSCHPLCPAPSLQLEPMTGALDVAGRPCLHRVLSC
jgi:hypothetical protein